MPTHAEAVVLAGHGSRSDEANASLAELARTLAVDLGVAVYPAYLEMAEPSIPAALAGARADGAGRIILLPYFLSPGMHVKRDLVAIVDEARAGGARIEIADFLGAHPAVSRLLTDIARGALAARPRTRVP